jgi:putative glutamine amidotransferase
MGITLSRDQIAPGSRTSYEEAVAVAGGIPVAIPYGLDLTSLRRLFVRLHGILLSGGGDIEPGRYGRAPSALSRGVDVERDALEIQLTRWAVDTGRPILGICRGLQIMNVSFGGTLIQDIASEVPGALPHDQPEKAEDRIVHSVDLEPGLLRGIQRGRGRLEVNSSHHQAVRNLGEGLRVCGRSPDGLIEAVEVPGHPFAAAVQWHPERLPERPEARALFRGLIRAASQR